MDNKLIHCVSDLLNSYSLNTVREKAFYYALLQNLKDFVEEKMSSLKEELIKANVNETFEVEQISVNVAEGSKKYDFDVQEVYQNLVLDDFLKIVSILSGEFKKINFDLWSKLRKEVGQNASYIKVNYPKKSNKTLI